MTLFFLIYDIRAYDFIFRTANYADFRNYQLINNSYVSLQRYFEQKYTQTTNKTFLFYLKISTKIQMFNVSYQ